MNHLEMGSEICISIYFDGGNQWKIIHIHIIFRPRCKVPGCVYAAGLCHVGSWRSPRGTSNDCSGQEPWWSLREAFGPGLLEEYCCSSFNIFNFHQLYHVLSCFIRISMIPMIPFFFWRELVWPRNVMDSVVTCLAFALATRFWNLTLVQDAHGAESSLDYHWWLRVIVIDLHHLHQIWSPPLEPAIWGMRVCSPTGLFVPHVPRNLAAPWALEVWLASASEKRPGWSCIPKAPIQMQFPLKCQILTVLTRLFLLHYRISPNHVSNECGARKIKSCIWAEDLLGSYGRASAHAGIEAAREICRLFAVHVLVCSLFDVSYLQSIPGSPLSDSEPSNKSCIAPTASLKLRHI